MAEHGVRPKAWGVLAVSLALMALVAALSSTTGHQPTAPLASSTARSAPTSARGTSAAQPGAGGSGPGRYTGVPRSLPAREHPGAGSRGLRRPPHDHGGRPGHEHAATVTGGTRTPAAAHLASTPALGSLAVVGDAEHAASGAAGSASGGTAGAGGAGGAGGGTASAAGAAGAAGSASGGAAGAAGSSPASASLAGTAGPLHHGTFSFPTTSATVSAPGGSTVNATATWTGTSTLQLAITCPDGVSASQRGPSGLSLEVDDTAGGPGRCYVRLSTPAGVRADVAFTLTVEPAP